MAETMQIQGTALGQKTPRVDGRLKVTGQARYASDEVVSKPAYAVLVTSPIARGTITKIDLSAAKAVPGLLEIFTHENVKTGKGVNEGGDFIPQMHLAAGGSSATSMFPLTGPEVRHDGEIVAMVVAETFEAAREASFLVRIDYREEKPTASFGDAGADTKSVAEMTGNDTDPKVGDADAAFGKAPVQVDEKYGTPTQHHNPIELFTTTCVWQGAGKDAQLTVYEPHQGAVIPQHGFAAALGLDPTQVRLIARYTGGAFGSKGIMTPRTVLVAMAARRLNRAVKLVPTRDQGFTIATYRAETRQHIKLGARKDGTLEALIHEGWEVSSRPDNYKVGGTESTARLYACPNVRTRVNITKADRNTPGFMRSPPEVPYLFALECAVDELADKLSMCPIELRRKNDTTTDPITGKPYSSRKLMECFDRASKAFGWSKRGPTASMKITNEQGEWQVGYGCATTLYPTNVAPTASRISLKGEKRGEQIVMYARVQMAVADVGSGAYTVIAQTAAEFLGLPIAQVEVELGDSSLPAGIIAGGSMVTASACNSVHKSCSSLLTQLAQAASRDKESPLHGKEATTMRLADGHLVAADGSKEPLDQAVQRVGANVEVYAEFIPETLGPEQMQMVAQGSMASRRGITEDGLRMAFGAQFVEVHVHTKTREIRVPRMVGAFAGGRILNPTTAHSQLMGGMIWGISSALHEATEIDRRTARYMNDNLADYLMPVNADIRQVEVLFVDDEDTEVNPLGIKGIGELGNVGMNAAVANAVWHATGKRIRELPIRIEKLL